MEQMDGPSKPSQLPADVQQLQLQDDPDGPKAALIRAAQELADIVDFIPADKAPEFLRQLKPLVAQVVKWREAQGLPVPEEIRAALAPVAQHRNVQPCSKAAKPS
jgi:hypothetical protein